MTIITGTTKSFKQMFELIMCGSKYPLFSTTILRINDNTISINSMDQSRAVGTDQEYYGFDVEGNDDIPIDTVSIYEAIKLFDDNDSLTLEYENNKIIILSNSSDKKDTITIPTINIDEINNISPIKFTNNSVIINEKEMTFESNAKVNTKYIQNQIKKGNYVNSLYHEYNISINENTLILSVGDVNSFELSTSSEIEVEGEGIGESKFAHGYDDIFKTLSGDVIIYINENKLMLITQIKDEYSIKYLISPVVEG